MAWLKNRFRYAFAGVRYGLFHDKSIRFQALAGLCAVLAGFVFKIGLHEWLWVLLSIALVLMAEIFNSCLEKTIDYISLERNPQARLVKDMAAAAVLVVSCFAFIVALAVFGPPFIEWCKSF